jgi:hypothetical protein
MKRNAIRICVICACVLICGYGDEGRTAPEEGQERKVDDAVVTVYTRVETNWSAGAESTTLLWPPEANAITYTEIGTVCSNTYLRVQWREHDYATQIESVAIGYKTRAYTLEANRMYIEDHP